MKENIDKAVACCNEENLLIGSTLVYIGYISMVAHKQLLDSYNYFS